MKRAVVTGAFSNIGAAAAGELARSGLTVHTLTNRQRPAESPFSSSPLRFDEDYLTRQLDGVDLFVNTYWVRLPYAGQSFESAVTNSRLLIDAARKAGVERCVHVSVSNPERGVNLGYYRGKAAVEAYLHESGLSWGIVRPTLVVGPNDILSNNIAWFLRRFPFFPMPRGGTCRLQPVTLTDVARIICEVARKTDQVTVDAAGPDVMTFREYVQLIASVCGVEHWLPATPNWVSILGIRLVELLLRDIVLTREELLGLQQELLLSHKPARGSESVASWLQVHARNLGEHYANDLDRHFRVGRSLPITIKPPQPSPTDLRAR